ncbi:Gfo/Idh/MocA family protein [Shouchella clausii]|uniref:Dehydrogenase n=1 Tax=Shouchella clausii TaxID=79880 RepID=A0A268P0Z6_SHOCL|nr:Gfo/Idh/MocA family oxidoreductase [Shouchella clausii]PAE89416.1 dehydrogenase [Shouchella clausii]
MRVGIISFAHGHAYSYASSLRNIEDVELVGIADDDQERGKQAAKTYETAYYPTYQALLAEKLDAVVVTSENSRHKEHAVAAARAKAAVLCEKPLASTAEDAQEIIDVCNEEGVLLQTAFPVRFNEAVARAKQRIDADEFGDIVAIKGTNRGKNPGGWFNDEELAGGGAVIDHTVHVVDIMRWVLDDEVAQVYAEVDQLFSGNGVDDAGLLTLTFHNGVFATLDCSWSRNDHFPIWGDVTIEFIGTKGTLKVDAQGQKFDVFHGNGLSYTYWGDDMDDGLIRDFIASVQTNRAPSISGTDGLRALEVALGAYEAAATKEVVVLQGKENEGHEKRD